jgi:hypothetical protein
MKFNSKEGVSTIILGFQIGFHYYFTYFGKRFLRKKGNPWTPHPRLWIRQCQHFVANLAIIDMFL